MIASPRSKCMTYHPLGEALEVANDNRRQGSMKGRAEVERSCPCLGDKCTLYLRSFYLGYRNER